MSLSLDILKKNKDVVQRRIALGSNVNDFDAYGYTPLIMAIMTEQDDIVELLLSKGADCNRPDIFGQPPLHWAIKTESISCCEMLLNRGAFPNTVSSYGEPLLVYPLLKKNQKLIQVLSEKGTHRECAEDYILNKSIGHQFELQGFGLFKNYNLLISLVDYQGFRLEFSICQLSRQFETMVSAGKFASPYANAIVTVLQQAQKLRMLKKALPSTQEAMASEYLGPINFIPLAFDGHAVSLAQSSNFVACCDRSQGQLYTTIIYRMRQPLTKEQLMFLLYGKKDRLFWKSLPEQLGWQTICSIDVPFQTIGNCSWANIEPGPILLEALIALENGEKPQPEKWAESIRQWSLWNKNNLLNQSLIRASQCQGDRQFALLLTLLHIALTYSNPKELDAFDSLMETLSRHQAIWEQIGYQHEIARTQWWPRLSQWSQKREWKFFS